MALEFIKPFSFMGVFPIGFVVGSDSFFRREPRLNYGYEFVTFVRYSVLHRVSFIDYGRNRSDLYLSEFPKFLPEQFFGSTLNYRPEVNRLYVVMRDKLDPEAVLVIQHNEPEASAMAKLTAEGEFDSQDYRLCRSRFKEVIRGILQDEYIWPLEEAK